MKSENSMLSEIVEREVAKEATCDCHWNKIQARAACLAVAKAVVAELHERIDREELRSWQGASIFARGVRHGLQRAKTLIRLSLSAPRPEGSETP